MYDGAPSMRFEDDGKLKTVPLTQSEIEGDLLLSVRNKSRRLWDTFSCYALFGIIGVILWSLSGRGWFLIALAVPLCALAWVIYRLVLLHLEKQAILRGEYLVMRQKLVNIGRERYREPHISCVGRHTHIHLYRSAEVLYFKSQEWRFPDPCYTWCEQYRKNSVGYRGSFRETFVIGDDFFIVIPNRTYEIEAAYHVNYFTYDGVITQ